SVILDSIYRSINESTTNKIYSLSLHDALPICRGAAVHAAVVDAGEHDEARDRVELEGHGQEQRHGQRRSDAGQDADDGAQRDAQDRKSTRLNSSHVKISYAVFCLKKKKKYYKR